MRCLCVAIVLIFAESVAAQDNEAEKLFRGMEKLIRDAKSIKTTFQIEADLDKNSGKINGDISVAEGNKARIHAAGNFGGTERVMVIVADGVQQLYGETSTPKAEPRPVSPDLSKALAQIVARGGVMAAIEFQEDKGPFNLDKLLPVSDFKLGKKEMIGLREAQAVNCTVKPPDGRTIQMTVWLDSKTNLPLKRLLSVNADKGVNRVTEVYTEITLNPMLDAKLFELPK